MTGAYQQSKYKFSHIGSPSIFQLLFNFPSPFSLSIFIYLKFLLLLQGTYYKIFCKTLVSDVVLEKAWI